MSNWLHKLYKAWKVASNEPGNAWPMLCVVITGGGGFING
jgi:hypothetical protein